MNNIHIPALLFWENGNSWYGSLENARFYIRPEASEEGEDKRLSIRLWQGALAMELSTIIASASFPLSEEGLVLAAQWLEEQAAGLNRK